MPTLADVKRQFLEDNTGLSNKSIHDLEWAYYTARSGLTPAVLYSITDHKRAYLEAQTGQKGSLAFLENLFLDKQGVTQNSRNNRLYDYFDFHPLRLPNLELALDSRRIGGELLAWDSFDRADGPLGTSPSGHTWIATGGTFTIESGKVVFAPNGATNYLWMDVGATDVEVSAILTRGSGSGSTGLAARFTDSANCVFVILSDSKTLTLYKTVAGVNTVLQQKINAVETSANVKLVVKGSIATVYQDGIEVLSGNVSDVPLGTRVGLRFYNVNTLNGASADNFEARTPALTDGDAVGLWPDLSWQQRLNDPVKNLLNFDAATFETGVGGWVGTSQNPTITRVTTPVFQGSGALSVTATSANIPAVGSPWVSVTPGKTYFANAFMRAATTIRGWSIVLQFANNSSIVETITGTPKDNSLTGWLEGNLVSGVAPSGVNQVRVVLQARFNAHTIGEVHYFDAIGLYEGSVPLTWKSPIIEPRHVTQATAARRPLYRSVNKNLLTYPAAVASYVGNPHWEASTGGTVALETAAPISGGSSIKLTINAGFTEGRAIANRVNTNSLLATPGQTYYAQVTVKNISTVAISVHAYIEFFRNNGTYLTSRRFGNNQAPRSMVAGETFTFTGPILGDTAPAEAVQMQMLIMAVGAAGDSIIIDNAMVSLNPITAWVPPVVLPNSQPVLQFDGVDDWLGLDAGDIAQPVTVYLVPQVSAYAANTQAPLLDGGSGSATAGRLLIQADGNGTFVRTYAGSTYSGGDSANIGTVRTILCAVFSAGSAAVYRNGAALVSNAGAGSNSLRGIRLGADWSAGKLLAGDHVAVLIYSGAHDADTRKRIEKWLGAQFGIAVA